MGHKLTIDLLCCFIENGGIVAEKRREGGEKEGKRGEIHSSAPGRPSGIKTM